MHACMTVIATVSTGWIDISETVKDASSSATSSLHLAQFKIKDSMPGIHLSIAVQSDFTWRVMQSKKVICTPFKDIPTLLTTPADVLRLVALLETYHICVGNADIALSRSVFTNAKGKICICASYIPVVYS